MCGVHGHRSVLKVRTGKFLSEFPESRLEAVPFHYVGSPESRLEATPNFDLS
jgi:hypothetical protein